jgi:hypothetical protein
MEEELPVVDSSSGVEEVSPPESQADKNKHVPPTIRDVQTLTWLFM